jgi:hypothetical protein
MSSIRHKYNVMSIDAIQTHEWILKKHYAKRLPSISYAFGLYESGILLGILTIGKPASPSLCVGVCGANYSEFVYELNRLCVCDNLERNVLSYFVAGALKLIKESLIIVSYADSGMGHFGYIYQATNWIYTGATKERTDIGLNDGTHSRHYNKSIDKKANRKHRSSKYRYIYFIGKKAKEFRRNLKYSIYPYPKGENSRYDSSHKPLIQLTIF